MQDYANKHNMNTSVFCRSLDFVLDIIIIGYN